MFQIKHNGGENLYTAYLMNVAKCQCIIKTKQNYSTILAQSPPKRGNAFRE